MIRTDNAPAFQKLLNESSKENSIFKTLNINLQPDDALNSNKNPIAENAVKELEKEFLRLGFSNQQIQPLVLSLAVKNMNKNKTPWLYIKQDPSRSKRGQAQQTIWE